MPNDAAKLYQDVCRWARRTAVMTSIEELLGWDERTQMPSAGAEHRAEQSTLLAGLIHQRWVDPKFGGQLDELAASPLAADPQSDAGVVVRRLKRQYQKKIKLPQTLVEELARTAVLGQQAWQEAREKDDFPSFRPLLEKMIGLKRQQAEALGYPQCPYDALLDDYEPEELTANVGRVLAGLREELVPLVAEIRHSRRRPNTALLHRSFPVEVQERFGREAAAAIGFDFARGRLDVTAHPFCSHAGPARLPHHHPLRPTVLQLGLFRHPARGRARHLRAGFARRTLRPAPGRGDFAGDPRVAVAAVGKPRRPQPGVLDVFLSPGTTAVSRRAGQHGLRRVLFRHQRRSALAGPRRGRRGHL